jgi:hypothetical protein
LFIEICWRVFQAILKYYWSVQCDFEEISNKYYFSKTIYFQLNREENGKYNSSSKKQLESEKKWRFFNFLDKKNLILSRDPVPLTIIKACNF